jgi:4-hydroxy-tetrahydrodipicolinate reductase
VASKVPVLVTPNMSVGINLLLETVGQVARALGEQYDIEIVETHHRRKKDAPSGTALKLAHAICQALSWDPKEALIYGRQGEVGERPGKQIALLAVRGGDVVGDHTVIFAGEGERIELTHRASSRDVFARGAIRAARFLAGRAPGLYSMKDVLF